MKSVLRVIVVVGLGAMAGACASAAAKSAERPDLVVPPPPPRVIPINSEPILEPVAEMPAAPGSNAPASAARPPRPSTPRPVPTETKPETKPDQPVTETPPPAPPPPAPAVPAPQLRTAESNAAETAIRGSLERTRSLLNGIDYGRLSTARKRAYEDAKRFAQQAEDSLKAGNAVFAQGVATKAETLARELAGK
jgi:outer membrane biosynthesis protein TonB